MIQKSSLPLCTSFIVRPSNEMDPVLTCLLGSIMVLSLIWVGIRSVLAPTVPIKGTTNVPGPIGIPYLPFLGHAWKFMGASSVRVSWDITERLIASDHKVASIWLGPKLIIGTAHPKVNEVVLKSLKANTKPAEFYGYFNKMADGVFTRNGKAWSDLRRPLNRLLQPINILGNFTRIFEENIEKICGSLDKICDQGTFNILIFVQTCKLDIILETLMGIPAAQSKKLGIDPHVAKQITDIVFPLTHNPKYQIGMLFNFSKVKKEFTTLHEKVTRWGQKLLERRATILSEKGVNPEDPDFEPECYTDVTMKIARNENHEGHSLPVDVIIAGYDTSSVTVSTALLFLAMHPEYQEKSYQEQIKIMGYSWRSPNQEEMIKMEFLWMVIQETLRHVGSPTVLRQLSSQVVVDDYILPEGAVAYVSLQAMHMNPEYWVKAKEFHPDHFLPENVSKRPRNTFLPFSSGTRVCPGKNYASVMMKMMLSVLLRRYKFHTPLKFEEMDYELGIMMESAKGYPLELTRRNFSSAAEKIN